MRSKSLLGNNYSGIIIVAEHDHIKVTLLNTLQLLITQYNNNGYNRYYEIYIFFYRATIKMVVKYYGFCTYKQVGSMWRTHFSVKENTLRIQLTNFFDLRD